MSTSTHTPSVSLAKITPRHAFARHSHLHILGRVTKVSDKHVWIMAQSITGAITRASYPVPPLPIKVDREDVHLYR